MKIWQAKQSTSKRTCIFNAINCMNRCGEPYGTCVCPKLWPHRQRWHLSALLYTTGMYPFYISDTKQLLLQHYQHNASVFHYQAIMHKHTNTHMLHAEQAEYKTWVGFIKWIFSVLLFSQFFRAIKPRVTCMISHSYLTGVTTAELRWHLTNMNRIERI